MTTETKSTQPAVIKPRNTGMKWQKLGEAKDPEFLDDLLLHRKKTDGNPDYYKGYLKSISITDRGKVYSFVVGRNHEGEEVEVDDFTHFAIPKPPVD